LEKVNAYPVYLVGAHLGPLYNFIQLPKITLGQILKFAVNAQNILGKFLNDTIVPFRGSKDKAKELLALLNNLLTEDRLSNANKPLDQREVVQIMALVREFETIFEIECNHLDVYFINQKRAWDMSILTNEAENVLGKVKAMLEGSALDDWRQAGRCLAFDVPTASGFHMFRVIESVVLKYFPIFGLSVPTKKGDKNLGHYIKILEDKGLDTRIVEMLRHLKEFYRNPLMHPEKFLTSDEAEGLFGFAQSAVSRMLEDQENEKKKRTSSPP